MSPEFVRLDESRIWNERAVEAGSCYRELVSRVAKQRLSFDALVICVVPRTVSVLQCASSGAMRGQRFLIAGQCHLNGVRVAHFRASSATGWPYQVGAMLEPLR